MTEESPAAERPIRIRPATVDDTEAIVGLLDELGYPLEPVSARALIHDLISDPVHRLLVAEDSGTVGFLNLNLRVQLHHGRPVGTIDELVVAEGRRGDGIGRELVESAVALATEVHADLVELTTRRETARRFYERCGFVATSDKMVYPLRPGAH